MVVSSRTVAVTVTSALAAIWPNWASAKALARSATPTGVTVSCCAPHRAAASAMFWLLFLSLKTDWSWIAPMLTSRIGGRASAVRSATPPRSAALNPRARAQRPHRRRIGFSRFSPTEFSKAQTFLVPTAVTLRLNP